MALRIRNFGWRCRCNGDGRLACQVPPSPDVMANLFLDYKRSGKAGELTFKQYLVSIGFIDPAATTVGMDDSAQFVATPGGPELLAIPADPVIGQVQVKVLLVDFDDRPGVRPRAQFEDLLFSKGIHPSGSMRDYYNEVSLGKVDVVGTVSDWIRLPQPYSFYTNNESGTRWESYPNNAPRMAEDAVQAALAKGVTFDASLDTFGRGIVTALFIVHSGRGAEKQTTRALQNQHIWSHKWQLRNPVQVGPDLAATIYLTVPQDCKLGVCAHELGHLAFQWQDFYDPNYNEDGTSWDGTGDWDLMASGSYNGGELKPAHPAALHKIQHGWVPLRTVTKSTSLRLKPYTATSGGVVKLVSPGFRPKQYLLLEARKRTGFDSFLPGEGLLVWKVDEPKEQTGPQTPGLSLVQADGLNDMNDPNDVHQGDDGDPFPGSSERRSLGDQGVTSTSFGTTRSRITLRNIAIDGDGVVTLDVQFAGSATGKATSGGGAKPKPGKAGAQATRRAAAKPASARPKPGKAKVGKAKVTKAKPASARTAKPKAKPAKAKPAKTVAARKPAAGATRRKAAPARKPAPARKR